MASGSNLPLRGPSLPTDFGSCLCWKEKNRRHLSVALGFQASKFFKRLVLSQDRWRLIQPSAPIFMENIGGFLFRTLSELLSDSGESDASLLAQCSGTCLDFSHRSLKASHDVTITASPGECRLIAKCSVASNAVQVSRSGNGRFDSESPKAGIAKHSNFSLDHSASDLSSSNNRPLGGGAVTEGVDWLVCLPEHLKGAAKKVDDVSLSEPAGLKNPSGRSNVRFHWLNKTTDGQLTFTFKDTLEQSFGGFRVVASGDIDEDNFLALPGGLEGYQSLQRKPCGNWERSMGCLEGASRGPGRRTARGWEVIKAGMEMALGRSITPASNGHSAIRYPVRFAAGLERASRASDRLKVLVERSCGDTRLAQLGSVIETGKERSKIGQLECSGRAGELSKEAGKQSLLSLKMGDNAIAGALAGTFVSLCLHPVDTVKTVIQAQSLGQRSVFHTIVSIVSDRGVSGLYRGLGSNLTSSAPISAIYTFTYESVKAALIPHLAKEYHALAHCAAGGCASIATSFVYTPSECVKQRMQVGSLYPNSWMAFVGILRNGGLSVLYSGWGAVLCRNVPQSVIKFYTYEGLKHWALTGHPAGTPLSTLQTLAFGGLAGSTAAMFTTPFDVIKTRLQTQVPGSLMYQKGVLEAFQHIAASEGLGGLYRGLIPRLVIYVSQGALFFASYEFFKRIMAVEVRKMPIQSAQSSTRSSVDQATLAEST